jgi:hypothetical protein
MKYSTAAVFALLAGCAAFLHGCGGGCGEEDVKKCVDAYTTAILDLSASATVCTGANTYYQCLKDADCCDDDDQKKAIDASIAIMNSMCTGSDAVTSKC